MKTVSSDSPATRSRTLCLTNSAVKGATPGETLWDTEVTGLHLRVKPSGTRSYYLYYRTKMRRERRPKLGDANIITLAQARDDARAKLAFVATGGDPVADRELVMGSPTVDALFDRVYREHWHAKKTADEIYRRYAAYCQGKRPGKDRPAPTGWRLGEMKVREVTYDDVIRLHGSMKATPYQANRLLTDVRKMFNYAERPLKWRDLHTNPCTGVVYYPEKKRRKFFKADHLRRLIAVLDKWAALPGEDRVPDAKRRAAAYLTFMLYTGCRPEEPEAITPEIVEVHQNGEEHGVARLPDSKTGQRDIYVPPQAMAALRTRPWKKGQPILGRFPKKLWPVMRREAGCEDLWARDTRRTFGTAVLSTVHGAQAGELLGHKSAQTTKRYLQLIEDSARDAAAAGAARIDQLGRATTASR